MTAVWVAVLVLALALAYYGMWHGWRGRARRQGDLPAPLPLGDVAGVDRVDGTYVSTTTGGHWMDRIAAHELGTPSAASLGSDGSALLVAREGARGFRIPAADLQGVRRTRGIAGKVREPGGIVVLTWMLGGRELDTGFRPARAADADVVEAAVTALMAGAGRG